MTDWQTVLALFSLQVIAWPIEMVAIGYATAYFLRRKYGPLFDAAKQLLELQNIFDDEKKTILAENP